ncbi:Uma2 family endonuclease [Rhodopirellula sp. JC639]|uniref:Uma2 family endonuclease n=1 Tax=Stieleria mannarensis TaxID=2755585 RepID=UPI0016002E6F|nr:Uma2 family endonuclease [Rhodopirellula sp. JC639]
MTIASHLEDAEQRVTLGNVSWQTYVDLCESADNPRGRLTYDQGELEIMSPSYLHENVGRLIGRMIEMFTFHHQIEIHSAKSTTFKRERKQRGFEADESYYISHASAIHGISHVDLEVHPPPDLVIEVDISRSSSLKMRVFAGLGVGEVWCFDGEKVIVYRLSGDAYEVCGTSTELPRFPLTLMNTLLTQRSELSEHEMISRFVKSMDSER